MKRKDKQKMVKLKADLAKLKAAIEELENRVKQAMTDDNGGAIAKDMASVFGAIAKIDRGVIESFDWDLDIWGIVVENDLKSVCEYLLENNVSFGRPSTEESPLMNAVIDGRMEIVRMMLEHGWNPNEWTDVDDETPLTLAAYYGRADIFFLLLQHGAKLHLVGYDHELTFDPEGERFDITPERLLVLAICGRNLDICRYLSSHLEDAAHWPDNAWTPYHLYDNAMREFCMSSGIDILATKFVPALDAYRASMRKGKKF